MARPLLPLTSYDAPSLSRAAAVISPVTALQNLTVSERPSTEWPSLAKGGREKKERRPNAVGRRWPLSTHHSRMRRIDGRSAMGHEERFPPTRLSAGCGFRKETIADLRGTTLSRANLSGAHLATALSSFRYFGRRLRSGWILSRSR